MCLDVSQKYLFQAPGEDHPFVSALQKLLCAIVAWLPGSPNAALGNKEGSLPFRQTCLLATQLTLKDANPSFNWHSAKAPGLSLTGHTE